MSASLGYEHARTGSAASLPPTRVPVVWGQRDALFEILDAVLSAPSLETPAHLSLTPTCQRGWGSLYDALNAGTMNLTRLETLVASYPVDPPHAQTAWYAVDASVWPRCDAETSPDRGYYHHPYRHSHGQPIVAGWNYSWLVQLPRRCSSWTAPLRVRRIIPGANSNLIAAEHMRSWLGQAPPAPPLPIFTFDAGDDPVHLSLALDDLPVCLLGRLRAGRCFSADPTSQPQTGRPRRHGAKFVCDDPTTWPTPSQRWSTTDPRHGAVCLQAWSGLHATHGRWCGEPSFASKSPACRVRPNSRSRSGSGGTGRSLPIWQTSGGPISPASPLSIPSVSSSKRSAGRRPHSAHRKRLTAGPGAGPGCSSWPIVICAWRVTPSPMYACPGRRRRRRCQPNSARRGGGAGAFRTSSHNWAVRSARQNPVDGRRDAPKASALSTRPALPGRQIDSLNSPRLRTLALMLAITQIVGWFLLGKR